VLVGRTATRRWRSSGDALAIDEVVLAGEALERTAHQLLATLLHEAAHALGRVRAINDTSRQHRYHNLAFRTLADELGLVVERHPLTGWATTSLPTTTAQRYATTISVLQHALQLYRCHERAAPRPQPRTGTRAYVCGCGRRIRVARSVFAQGDILCANCIEPFDPID
jgi:hypothetical protein